jgi:hypothetical protein
MQRKLRDVGVGLMAQPTGLSSADKKIAEWEGTWAADNGCFNAQWTPHVWLDWLEKMGDTPGCLFAVVPDRLADAVATRQMFSEWGTIVSELGYPPAYVAQNGATPSTIPWDEIACVFIGGDTAWKLGPQAEAIVRYGRRLGVWTHMGRVNSLRRFRIAADWGVDSCDGTYLKFGPDVNTVRLVKMLNRVEAEPSLFGGA